MWKWTLALLSMSTALYAQAPALSERTVLGLLAGLPAFASPGPRAEVELRRQMPIPETSGEAHFVEIAWKEAGAARTALLAVVRSTRLNADVQALASHEGWSVVRIQEDANWDTLIRDLKAARDSGRTASVVGNLRAMVSAQVTFAAILGDGRYAADQRCLVTPRSCGLESEPLLLNGFPNPERMGYRYALTPTGAVSTLRPGARVSAGFVFTATPTDDPSQPSFCTDQEGVVCSQPGGTPLVVAGGKCPAACVPMP